MLILLLVAGNETTTTLIGNTVLTLLDQPEALERLRREPEARAVRDRRGAALLVARAARPAPRLRDVELCGEKVREGEMAIGWLGSANRDESVFRESDRFDVARKENRHLAFGFGTHYCLGSNLARLEAQIALRRCSRTPRASSYDPRPLPLHRSLVFRSFTAIPVELVPA